MHTFELFDLNSGESFGNHSFYGECPEEAWVNINEWAEKNFKCEIHADYKGDDKDNA